MNDARQRAADTVPLLSPAVVSQMFPFYEGLAIVVKDSVQNLLLAALAVVIVISVILAKLMAALVVSLVVVLTDVMLLGENECPGHFNSHILLYFHVTVHSAAQHFMIKLCEIWQQIFQCNSPCLTCMWTTRSLCLPALVPHLTAIV